MRHAVYLPIFGTMADPRLLADLAAEAEAAEWDGCFLWDHLAMWWDPDEPVADPWIALAAMAVATEHIRIGTLVTPLARRRPWKVARETVTLDHLSGGRVVLGVGLGANPHEFERLGEPAGLAARAEIVDEALEVITALWRGSPVHHRGIHFSLDTGRFLPTPLQQPRIPIWVATSWPKPRPLARALRWDGAVAALAEPGDFNTPIAVIEEIAAAAQTREAPGGFDIVLANGNPDWDLARDAAEVAAYEAAGLTWWLEDIDPWRFGGSPDPPWRLGAMRERIAAGPPRRR